MVDFISASGGFRVLVGIAAYEIRPGEVVEGKIRRLAGIVKFGPAAVFQTHVAIPLVVAVRDRGAVQATSGNVACLGAEGNVQGKLEGLQSGASREKFTVGDLSNVNVVYLGVQSRQQTSRKGWLELGRDRKAKQRFSENHKSLLLTWASWTVALRSLRWTTESPLWAGQVAVVFDPDGVIQEQTRFNFDASDKASRRKIQFATTQ